MNNYADQREQQADLREAWVERMNKIASIDALVEALKASTGAEKRERAESVASILPISMWHLRKDLAAAVEGDLNAAERLRTTLVPGSAIAVVVDARAHATVHVGLTPHVVLHPLETHARLIATLMAYRETLR
jgi:hypothetical protein